MLNGCDGLAFGGSTPRLGRAGRRRTSRLCLLVFGTAATLTELAGLANALAEIVELAAANLAVANHFHLGDARRLHGKSPLHAFIVDNPADGEHRFQAAALSRYHGANEGLDALFGAFNDLHADRHSVADVKLQFILSEPSLLDGLDVFIPHDTTPVSVTFGDCLMIKSLAAQKVRSSIFRASNRLLHTPLVNLRVVSADQHIRHAQASKIARPRVLRILQARRLIRMGKLGE